MKLSQDLAQRIAQQAFDDIKKHPRLRLGQQLWNLMPVEEAMQDLKHENHPKWYNSTDNEYCLIRFYEDLVE